MIQGFRQNRILAKISKAHEKSCACIRNKSKWNDKIVAEQYFNAHKIESERERERARRHACEYKTKIIRNHRFAQNIIKFHLIQETAWSQPSIVQSSIKTDLFVVGDILKVTREVINHPFGKSSKIKVVELVVGDFASFASIEVTEAPW